MKRIVCAAGKKYPKQPTLSRVAALLAGAVILAASPAAFGQFDNTATSPPANGGQPTTGTTNSRGSAADTNTSSVGAGSTGNSVNTNSNSSSGTSSNNSSNSNSSTGANSTSTGSGGNNASGGTR